MSQSTNTSSPDLIRTAGATSPGVRDVPNRDLFLTADLRRSMVIGDTSSALAPEPVLSGSRGHVLVVADGSESAPSGALASHVALRTLACEWVESVRWIGPAAGETELRADLTVALGRCQSKLERLGWNDDVGQHPCSLTTALVQQDRGILAHSGQSAGILIRGTDVIQLTSSREPAGNVELAAVDLRPGDCLVLCSDGVSNYLNDADLAAAVHASKDAQDTASTITEFARRSGSPDDATVALARIPDAAGQPEAVETAAFGALRTPSDPVPSGRAAPRLPA